MYHHRDRQEELHALWETGAPREEIQEGLHKLGFAIGTLVDLKVEWAPTPCGSSLALRTVCYITTERDDEHTVFSHEVNEWGLITESVFVSGSAIHLVSHEFIPSCVCARILARTLGNVPEARKQTEYDFWITQDPDIYFNKKDDPDTYGY